MNQKNVKISFFAGTLILWDLFRNDSLAQT